MRRLTSPSPIVAHGSDRKTNSLPSVDFEESRCPHQLTSISPHFRSSCSLECSRSSARSPTLSGNHCGSFNNVFKKYYFYQTVRMYSLRMSRPQPIHVYRSVAAPQVRVPDGCGFHPFQKGEHIVVSPTRASRGCPTVVVLSLATHIQHAVDGAGSAQHLAGWPEIDSVVPALVRLSHVQPIQRWVADGFDDGGRNMDKGRDISPTCFEKKNRLIRLITSQPVG